MTVPHRFSLLTGLLAVAIPISGCSGASLIHKSELRKLDGFTAGSPVMIHTVDGHAVRFDGKTGLYLQMKTGEVQGFRFVRIACTDRTLHGTLATGESVEVEIDDVAAVKVTAPSTGRTIGLALGIAGGFVAATLFSLIVLAIIVLASGP